MRVISAVAESERELLLERTHSDIARVRAAGKGFGRPLTLNEEQQLTMIARINAGIIISDNLSAISLILRFATSL
ncbi:transposase [Buttiauxella gaviniae ATCC 51604]|uniref:Transposase n=1 Tax=Buttiauxella gaviniae ATCC 51604 TaxID=1354253 RepID=A0A1B7HJB3_9ENTR|nr:transposase [Buttiauxella gaviniae ATCC 51604]